MERRWVQAVFQLPAAGSPRTLQTACHSSECTSASLECTSVSQECTSISSNTTFSHKPQALLEQPGMLYPPLVDGALRDAPHPLPIAHARPDITAGLSGPQGAAEMTVAARGSDGPKGEAKWPSASVPHSAVASRALPSPSAGAASRPLQGAVPIPGGPEGLPSSLREPDCAHCSSSGNTFDEDRTPEVWWQGDGPMLELDGRGCSHEGSSIRAGGPSSPSRSPEGKPGAPSHTLRSPARWLAYSDSEPADGHCQGEICPVGSVSEGHLPSHIPGEQHKATSQDQAPHSSRQPMALNVPQGTLASADREGQSGTHSHASRNPDHSPCDTEYRHPVHNSHGISGCAALAEKEAGLPHVGEELPGSFQNGSSQQASSQLGSLGEAGTASPPACKKPALAQAQGSTLDGTNGLPGVRECGQRTAEQPAVVTTVAGLKPRPLPTPAARNSPASGNALHSSQSHSVVGGPVDRGMPNAFSRKSREGAESGIDLEWEDGGEESSDEMGLSGLFGASRSDMERQEVEVFGLGLVPMELVSSEERHTLRQTGLMRWTASPALANLLSTCPRLIQGAMAWP